MTPEERGRFIITADDYGIRETVPITLELVGQGKIDRVAVLIREVSDEDWQRLLATGLPIDLHLDLRGLLASGDEIDEGVFGRLLSFLFRLLAGRLSERRVEHVWREQIMLYRERFGCLPDGLNSHENIHFYPPFCRIMLRLADEYQVRFVRLGSEALLRGGEKGLVSGILSVLHSRCRRLFGKGGHQSTASITSLDWHRHGFRDIRLPAAGQLEVIVHPERGEEYQMLQEQLLSRGSDS